VAGYRAHGIKVLGFVNLGNFTLFHGVRIEIGVLFFILVPLPGTVSASSRVKSEPVSPTPEQATGVGNLPQPPSERSETIGSDSVEVYTPPAPSENTVRDARYLWCLYCRVLINLLTYLRTSVDVLYLGWMFSEKC
jgi:hypothetical protein